MPDSPDPTSPLEPRDPAASRGPGDAAGAGGQGGGGQLGGSQAGAGGQGPAGAASAAARELAANGTAGPSLLLLGIDHHTVPIELRERVAYGQDEAEKMLVHLLARSAIAEALLLSTCNRTEVVLQPRDEEEAYRAALDLVFLARAPEVERPGLLYVKRNQGAARHLLSVACGLESMVLGEPEILGQVKQAAALAEAVGAAGPVLRRLLRCALAAGRRARQETAISAGAVSLGYAVIELARNIFRDLDDCRVLLIGAGEIARAVARNLAERGARELTVANRSPERARQFQEEFPQSAAVPFDQRFAAIREADLVIASTGADEPVITRRQLAEELAPLRRDALAGHPWRDWAAAADGSARMPGAQSRWSAGKDLSWEPLRVERVCEVKYDHLQGDRFRHAATFLRWRPDKRPADCRYDQLEVTPPAELGAILAAAGRR